jgi:hypothetical protein
MPMRENCRHFESREEDDGETARFCTLDLAPEAPWRCPAECSRFEFSVNDGTFETSSLEQRVVEDEPDGDPEDIAELLRDAETIVAESEPGVIAEPHQAPTRRRGWKFWKSPPPDDGTDFRLSQR